MNALSELAPLRQQGHVRGITSVCSAHPTVIRAAVRLARDSRALILIEATCNQVNHQGGYTGMTPADFHASVMSIAAQENCPADLIMLGGDHLGPNVWRTLPSEEALCEAEQMIAAYVKAGFRKIHLDASMGCQGEPQALDDATTAARAVRLAAVAERAAEQANLPAPFYIIGTEVPPPGGADHVLSSVAPTPPEAAQHTIDVHRRAFLEAGLTDAFARVIGLVVQPGVEFGNQNVVRYDRRLSRDLSTVLKNEPQWVFEAHSTDYQGPAPLAELVEDGFVILKVGPELTFALRETLYALDLIASDLLPDYGPRPLMHAMEKLMRAQPEDWQRHYPGDPAAQRLMRHYSLSDRIRYYWPEPEANHAAQNLLEALSGQTIPQALFWQHLPDCTGFAGQPLDVEELLIWRISARLQDYHRAGHPVG